MAPAPKAKAPVQPCETRYQVTSDYIATIMIVDGHGRLKGFESRLLDLSQHGAKLQVPLALDSGQLVRLKLSVAELQMEFYVCAVVRWAQQQSTSQWTIGCSINPAIPDGILRKIAGEAPSAARQETRALLPISAKGRFSTSGRSEPLTIQNYSRGGFCALTRKPVRPGLPFQLTLSSSGQQDLQIAAKVQWQVSVDNGYLLGCSFQREQDFERLEQLLAVDAV